MIRGRLLGLIRGSGNGDARQRQTIDEASDRLVERTSAMLAEARAQNRQTSDVLERLVREMQGKRK